MCNSCYAFYSFPQINKQSLLFIYLACDETKQTANISEPHNNTSEQTHSEHDIPQQHRAGLQNPQRPKHSQKLMEETCSAAIVSEISHLDTHKVFWREVSGLGGHLGTVPGCYFP